jgi:hypothetical protein
MRYWYMVRVSVISLNPIGAYAMTNKTVTIPADLTISYNECKGVVDLSQYDASTIQDFINQAIRLAIRNTTAGMSDKTAAEKLTARKAKFDEIMKGEWKAGGTGKGGARLSIDEKAERIVLSDLFMKAGYKKANAEKAAKGEDAWYDYFLLAISAAQNREDVTKEEVEAVQEAHADYIKELVAEQVKIMTNKPKAAFDFNMVKPEDSA